MKKVEDISITISKNWRVLTQLAYSIFTKNYDLNIITIFLTNGVFILSSSIHSRQKLFVPIAEKALSRQLWAHFILLAMGIRTIIYINLQMPHLLFVYFIIAHREQKNNSIYEFTKCGEHSVFTPHILSIFCNLLFMNASN